MYDNETAYGKEVDVSAATKAKDAVNKAHEKYCGWEGKVRDR